MKVSLKCYKDGKFVGVVKAEGRKFRVGTPAYWAAYNNLGEWIGSDADREGAMERLYAHWAKFEKFPCPF